MSAISSKSVAPCRLAFSTALTTAARNPPILRDFLLIACLSPVQVYMLREFNMSDGLFRRCPVSRWRFTNMSRPARRAKRPRSIAIEGRALSRSEAALAPPVGPHNCRPTKLYTVIAHGKLYSYLLFIRCARRIGFCSDSVQSSCQGFDIVPSCLRGLTREQYDRSCHKRNVRSGQVWPRKSGVANACSYQWTAQTQINWRYGSVWLSLVHKREPLRSQMRNA